MGLVEIASGGLVHHAPTGFAELQVTERADLQRLLRDDIGVLGDDLLVIAEEYGEWADARRRIDLLAVDRSGQLVVIELKRTHDGGHAELQALRYAAFVSAMTFEDVLTAFRVHCDRHKPSVDPLHSLLTFLGSSPGGEVPVIATRARIVLVSADFGREIATTVLWLNEAEGVDIRCVRLVPYSVGSRVLLDVQQIIPLPEADDYRVRMRRKVVSLREPGIDPRDWTRYHLIVQGEELADTNKRNTVRLMVERLIDAGIDAQAIAEQLPGTSLRSVVGTLRAPPDIAAALGVVDSVDLGWLFLDHPMHQLGKTWILSKRWGQNTEPTLERLVAAFPEAGISFHRASES